MVDFNGTCIEEVKDDSYTGGEVGLHKQIADATQCISQCKNNKECRVFLYATQDNGYLKKQECKLFSKLTKNKKLPSNSNVTGLFRGRVNCTSNIKQCSPNKYEECANKVIKKRMENEPPPPCYEPCNYKLYTPHITTSSYPSKAHWDHTLNEKVPHYKSIDDARKNLAKLNIFADHLMINYAIQTQSYQIENFIAQFGGLTDLLIGISFFTVFQLIEVTCSKIYGRFKRE